MIWQMILLAIRAIRRNALRSSLTVLGIVIGVAAVITMVTLGDGVTAQVTAEISSLGTNLLQVRPGQGFHGPGGTRMPSAPLELEDAVAIHQNVPGLTAVAPVASKAAHAIFSNENWATTITGSDNSYLTVRNWPLSMGRTFTESELQGKAACIIGATVREKLFGPQNPLNSSLRLEKLSCRVIGVLDSKGQSSFGMDQDDLVLIPVRTFHRRVAGNQNIEAILVSARDGVSTEKVESDIGRLMRERRRISLGEDDDFHVRDMKELVNTMTGTTRVLTALVGAVAAISLLVGGIGIMNIMLVSVTERTREIGTRLAIGALEREVLAQFLIEAIVLSTFGGCVGIILGLLAAAVGAHFLKIPFIFNSGIVIVAFLFSAMVGIVFGFFPARKAASLDPIDALRYE